MSRGKQLKRTLELVQLLSRARGTTISEAAAELGCTRRTIYRDLEALEELGYPLYVDKDEAESTAWHLVDGFRWRHQIPFTHEEVCALWLGREALAGLTGTAFGEGARAAEEKIRATLSDEVRARLGRWQETLAVAPPSRTYTERAAMAAALRQAAEEQKSVELLYESLSERARRLFDPYLLWFDPQSASIYVAGLDGKHGEVRTLLLDRIKQVFPTERTFARVAAWDPKAYLSEGFSAFHGPPENVQLLFSGRAARLVAERTWHPSQVLTPRPDGELELSMQVPLSAALTGWVQSWLPLVRVLAPRRLASEVRRAIEGAMGMFEGEPRRAPPREDMDQAAARRRERH